MTEEADKLEEAAPLMEELADIIREEDRTKILSKNNYKLMFSMIRKKNAYFLYYVRT